jgi:hypothetical protein
MPIEVTSLPRTQYDEIQITGASMSGTARSKNVGRTIPTVPTAAGTLEMLIIMPFAATISSVRVAFKDALTQDGTNFVTFRLINKTTADSDVIAATDANTTKTTTGSAITAYTTRTLTLATAGGVSVAAQDVLALRITGAGTLANTLTEGALIINALVTG